MKNSSASTFLISLLAFLSSSFALSSQTCNPDDLKTLQKINAALGIKNPSGDCCGWDSVVCDKSPPYPVIELLFIDDSTISGQIPAATGDLSSLQILKFMDLPNLTGNIPPAITNLSQLGIFFITNTSLSGPIPAFLANLSSLKILDLSFNAFTGSIPPELSQTPKLNSLSLVGNKLTGTIPESFGHFHRRFKFLLLSNNFLTGTIPISMGDLNLQNIELSFNNFIGDASFLFGKKKTTRTLNLNGNNFTFDLSKVEFPPFLDTLNLAHNSIFGSLPEQLTEIIFLDFDVSYNRLCDEIPQGGRLQSFGIDSYVHNNCLCGAPLQACNGINIQ